MVPGDFVMCNDRLYETFMEFKKGVTYQNALKNCRRSGT